MTADEASETGFRGSTARRAASLAGAHGRPGLTANTRECMLIQRCLDLDVRWRRATRVLCSHKLLDGDLQSGSQLSSLRCEWMRTNRQPTTCQC